MYPFAFYMNVFSFAILTMLFHYPLQYIHLEKRYFERYSVNLMRSVACYLICEQSYGILAKKGLFRSYCTHSSEDPEEDLFYLFLAYIYYDTVVLIYQHYLGVEKKLRYDLLLHHLIALFSLTFIQNEGLYQFLPLICASEGISIVSGLKLLFQALNQKLYTRYCIQYRLFYLIYVRALFLWPFLLYSFFSAIDEESCPNPAISEENFIYMLMGVGMIYSAEYLWWVRGTSELKAINSIGSMK